MDEVAGHVGGGLRDIVEGGDAGIDDGAGVRGELHVADVDAVEGGLADAEDKRAALLEGDVRSALDEGSGEAVGDGGEGAHGAGKDDSGGAGIAAARDVCADIGVVMLLDFLAGGALFAGGTEKFFDETDAAAELQLFDEDAEGVGADDEIDLGDALVGLEGAEHLGRVDGTAGAGDGEGKSEWRGGGGERHAAFIIA